MRVIKLPRKLNFLSLVANVRISYFRLTLTGSSRLTLLRFSNTLIAAIIQSFRVINFCRLTLMESSSPFINILIMRHLNMSWLTVLPLSNFSSERIVFQLFSPYLNTPRSKFAVSISENLNDFEFLSPIIAPRPFKRSVSYLFQILVQLWIKRWHGCTLCQTMRRRMGNGLITQLKFIPTIRRGRGVITPFFLFKVVQKAISNIS